MNSKRIFSTFGRVCTRRNFHLNSSQAVAKKVAKDVTYPTRIFSGIQPTGSVHLGNYLGAIKQWKTLQDENDSVIYSIVDHHSITLPHDPDELYLNILEMTATLLACGIDPNKSILFQQSCVPQHTELCWQLACLSTMARLAHLPQYKEKSATLKDIPLGLFVYPVLQAADILIYKATHIPVGEDQSQQIELCQDLARMFNSRYGQTFPIPRAIMAGTDVCRLRSLRDPLKKMSKSDPDPKNRINLTDDPNDILKKIKKAVTDCTSEVYYDAENRPGVSNLISIHSALSGKNVEDICAEVKDLDTGKFKLIVADVIIEYLTPLRTEITKLMNDRDYLIKILENGAEKAQELAEVTAKEVRIGLGLRLREQTSINYKKIKI